MKLLKSILDFYIRSSLHVAVCFVGLAMVFTETAYATMESLQFNLLQFCLVVSSYNFIKYFDLILKHKNFRFKSSIIGVSLVSGISSVILLIPELPFIFPFIISTLFLVILYTFPLVFKRNFRSFKIVKIPIISACWTILIASFFGCSYLVELREVIPSGVTICFSNISAFVNLDSTILYLLLSIFFFVQALCIPFEIRDMKYDQPNSDNLAIFLGVNRIKILGYVFLILSFVFYNIYWNWSLFLVSTNGMREVVLFTITGLSIYFSDKFKSDYYSSFFVEAIPLLWLGLYYLL